VQLLTSHLNQLRFVQFWRDSFRFGFLLVGIYRVKSHLLLYDPSVSSHHVGCPVLWQHQVNLGSGRSKYLNLLELPLKRALFGGYMAVFKGKNSVIGPAETQAGLGMKAPGG
jgi:hypothetical protein